MPRIRNRAEGPPEVSFEPVGRNLATTFTGLCGQHDNELFAPIDGGINETDPFHLFLLTYRSVLREVHTSMRVAVAFQKTLNKSIELGRVDPDEASPRMVDATERLMQAYYADLYKMDLDTNLAQGMYDDDA